MVTGQLESSAAFAWRRFLRALVLFKQTLVPARFPGPIAYAKRAGILLLSLPLFFLLQLIHGVFLMADKLLFPKFTDIEIKQPLFILGVPRSGTTHTHHLLAQDSRFTTLHLWELLFAPSISQRYILRYISRLDSLIGAPLKRLLMLLERRISRTVQDIHPLSLEAPEEDFLLLMSGLDCFLLALIFPDARWLWKFAQGDRSENERYSLAILHRYRRFLQRHLYFYGDHKQLLSKNASFSGIAHALIRVFPDCLIVVCERDSIIAVRSQVRSLAPLRQLMGVDQHYPHFQTRLLDTLEFYYQNLQRLKQSTPQHRLFCITLFNLSHHPGRVMKALYQTLGLGSDRCVEIQPIIDALQAGPRIKPQTPQSSTSGTAINQTSSSEGAHAQLEALEPEFERFDAWRHPEPHRL